MNAQMSVSKERLAAFYQEQGIRRLAVFGSALRDDFGPKSDVGVLIEFQAGPHAGAAGRSGHEDAVVHAVRQRSGRGDTLGSGAESQLHPPQSHSRCG